jgi:excisionase family DNA binding protein
MESDKLFSVKDAAAFLGGISVWTVHAWLAKGKLRRTKVGSRTMIRESDLQAFIARCNPEIVTEPNTDSSRANELKVQ